MVEALSEALLIDVIVNFHMPLAHHSRYSTFIYANQCDPMKILNYYYICFKN